MASLETINLDPSIDTAIRKRLGEPEMHTIVVGAGAAPHGAFLDIDQATWEAARDRATAAFRSVQAAAKKLTTEGSPGRVVILVSSSSIRPLSGAALDATFGGFLTTIGQVGAVELGPSGVTVNIVAHGYLQGSVPEDLIIGIPAGRLTAPSDVANAVAFLAGSDAAYVTGAVLAVDGGFWITKVGGGSPLLSP
jgi:3-oxoacyl-[acyl-carrier protein] reductase